jgi:hypothetical protein
VSSAHWERSQGQARRSGLEVACLPSLMGLPLDQDRGRASPLRAKSVFSVSAKRSRVPAHAASGMPSALVLHAITSDTRNIHLTDEVSRCPGLGGQVSANYKPDAKGLRHAPVTGRGSPQPRLWRCQQRQSRGACTWETRGMCSERQNLRVPFGSLRFMGPVSPVIKAAQWPGRTFSCQLASLLSNSPQQPERRRAAVRQR